MTIAQKVAAPQTVNKVSPEQKTQNLFVALTKKNEDIEKKMQI